MAQSCSSAPITEDSRPTQPTLKDVSEPTRDRFERLIGDVYPSALRVARQRYRAYGISPEDLVQDAALRAWRRFDSFEVGTNFSAWFFCIMHNNYLNTFKKHRRHKDALLQDPTTLIERSASTTFYDQEAWLNQEHPFPDEVLAALGTLHEDFRTIILRHTFEDRSDKELARDLDIPAGTVMSRRWRARAHLREVLADYVR